MRAGHGAATTLRYPIPPMPDATEPTAEDERDTLFALLATAAVHATWDPSPLGQGPGHNIGAVLVDPAGLPVAFARNESSGRRDLTEHAELRLMRGRIAAQPERTELAKHCIYTTLEPCVMCAGMMLMTNIRRAVFAQPDPHYGGVFDRLAAGAKPYPKRVVARPAQHPALAALARGYAASGLPEIIHWLPTADAERAFALCARAFSQFNPAHPTNGPAYAAARELLDDISP